MPPFSDEPAGTREEIMHATYRALCEYGYADLTIERIGTQFAKSKSLIYHHYDGKDALLQDFLAFMLEQFESNVRDQGEAPPEARLEGILDHLLGPAADADRDAFGRAMVELRAQAAHDEAYRELFTRHDQFVREHLGTIVEAGVAESGATEVDPEARAAFLLAVVLGGFTLRATSNAPAAEHVRREADRYVRATIGGDV